MQTRITRRGILAGAGLLTAASALGSIASVATAAPNDPNQPVLEAEGIRVLLNGTDLHIQDASGNDRIKVHAVDLGRGIVATPTSVELGAVDDEPALLLEYEFTDGDGAALPRHICTGTVTVGDGGFFDVVFDLVLPPDFPDLNLARITRSFEPAEAFRQTTSIPFGAWDTDERGGIPYETRLGTIYSTPLAEGFIAHELGARNVEEWSGERFFRIPAEALGSTTHQMVYSGVIGDESAATAGALLGPETLRLRATTPQPFHLWNQEEAKPEFDLIVTNKAAPTDVNVDWVVRDWDGEVLSEGQQTLSDLEGIGRISIAFDQQVPRGIYFLSATATNGEEMILTRLNLSVLPEWQNEVPAEESKVGLAALFADAGAGYGVGRKDWLNLIQRFGVRHIRQVQMLTGEEAEQAGILRMAHRGPGQGTLRTGGEYPEGEVDVEARLETMEFTIDGVEEADSPWLEWCNEWNMHGPNIGDGTGMLTGASAPEYVHDVLIPMREYMDERGVRAKLCIMGLAGADYVWLEKLAEEGGWEITEGVALHPGRGNYTPDYAPDIHDEYWNYLGSIRKIKETIAKLDAQYGTHHELLITEVYAPTFANRWWTDDYRSAAENTLLSLALAFAEDVHSFYWYQLSDGVHWELDGIEPTDKEFDYGIVMVDGSLKASAIAFATAVEHLNASQFVEEIKVGPEDVAGHGLVFDGPDGEFQILWSRADGYILNADHGEESFYETKEPWIDFWPTKSVVELPADGEVTEIDCLGRKTILSNQGGTVSITLDGAPRIYYGLSRGPSPDPTPSPSPDPTVSPSPDPTDGPSATPPPEKKPGLPQTGIR